MFAEKKDCATSLVAGLNHTKGWRQRLMVKYSSDPRNKRSVESLAQLTIEAAELSDDLWLQLQPYYGWASERFREAVTQAARGVGFQNQIKDLPSFVEHLIYVLSQPVEA